MATLPSTSSPQRSIDARGRAIPMTEAEILARAEFISKALDEIAAITDETDTVELWEQFNREVNEDRLSDRLRIR